MFIGNGLQELGFEMDCGEALMERFPDADLSLETGSWSKILEQIDIRTLGNTIYSQWRYYTHWHNAPIDTHVFEWFVASFAKLAELTEGRYE